MKPRSTVIDINIALTRSQPIARTFYYRPNSPILIASALKRGLSTTSIMAGIHTPIPNLKLNDGTSIPMVRTNHSPSSHS